MTNDAAEAPDEATAATAGDRLDTVLFNLSASEFEALEAQMNRAPLPNARLERTMTARAPWDEPSGL
jgi:hypothetical protein